MLSTFVAFLLGSAIVELGHFGYKKIKKKPAEKTQEENNFFDHFMLSFETDEKWIKIAQSAKHCTAYFHKDSGLHFTLESTHNNNFQSYKPMIYRMEKDAVEVIHEFSSTEVEKLKTFIKMREVEKLTGLGLN